MNLSISELDKSYLAGLFDGEGCISISEYIRKNTSTPIITLNVVMSNNNSDVLFYFRDLLDIGAVFKRNYDNRPKWIDSWDWRISSNNAKEFLELLYPYFRIKKEQADIAIKFQKTMDSSKWKGRQVDPQILLLRQQYKEELTSIKGHKTILGRKRCVESAEIIDVLTSGYIKSVAQNTGGQYDNCL